MSLTLIPNSSRLCVDLCVKILPKSANIEKISENLLNGKLVVSTTY